MGKVCTVLQNVKLNPLSKKIVASFNPNVTILFFDRLNFYKKISYCRLWSHLLTTATDSGLAETGASCEGIYSRQSVK